uniref:Uncharacterized protein n=1 Tax=Anguilla anguilla TaxID=7936 RepID=A0A0E9ULR0_ANGAN
METGEVEETDGLSLLRPLAE